MTAGALPFWLYVVILAVIQGITEFIPVSSSGHLVLAQAFFGVQTPGVFLELVLHLGTLLAVIVHYRDDLVFLANGAFGAIFGRRRARDYRALEMLILLIVGTLPAVAAALLVGDLIEEAFTDPRMTCVFLIVTGVMLIGTLFIRRGRRRTGGLDALVVGLFQALALFPGISRSGSTITAGLLRGLRPGEAARFSFLLSIPAIVGASVFKFRELTGGFAGGDGWIYLLGLVISFAVGYAAISVLLRVLQGGKFGFFGAYCLLAGGAGLLFLSFR